MYKHSFRVQIITAVLLLVLLPAAALAQDDMPLLLTEITWDMTPEEVMESQGAGGVDVSQAYEDTGAQYVINHPAADGEPAQTLIFGFMSGELILYTCMAAPDALPGSMTPAAFFDKRLARLTADYGAPAEEPSWMTGMLMASINAGIADGSILSYALWELEDGTLIMLENRAEVGVSYSFINGPVLFGQEI